MKKVAKTLKHWFSDRYCSVAILTTGNDPRFNEIYHIAIIPLNMHYENDGEACTALIRPMNEDCIDFRKGSAEKAMIATALDQGLTVDKFIDYFDRWYTKLDIPYKKDGLSRGKLIPLGYNLYKVYPFIEQMFSKSYTEQKFTFNRGIDLNVARNVLNDLYSESGHKGDWIDASTAQRLLNKADIFAYSKPNALAWADNFGKIYRNLLKETNKYLRF